MKDNLRTGDVQTSMIRTRTSLREWHGLQAGCRSTPQAQHCDASTPSPSSLRVQFALHRSAQHAYLKTVFLGSIAHSRRLPRYVQWAPVVRSTSLDSMMGIGCRRCCIGGRSRRLTPCERSGFLRPLSRPRPTPHLGQDIVPADLADMTLHPAIMQMHANGPPRAARMASQFKSLAGGAQFSTRQILPGRKARVRRDCTPPRQNLVSILVPDCMTAITDQSWVSCFVVRRCYPPPAPFRILRQAG